MNPRCLASPLSLGDAPDIHVNGSLYVVAAQSADASPDTVPSWLRTAKPHQRILRRPHGLSLTCDRVTTTRAASVITESPPCTLKPATFVSPFLLPLATTAVRRPLLLPCRVARARDAQSEQLQRGSDRRGGQRHSGRRLSTSPCQRAATLNATAKQQHDADVHISARSRGCDAA